MGKMNNAHIRDLVLRGQLDRIIRSYTNQQRLSELRIARKNLIWCREFAKGNGDTSGTYR